MASLNDAVRDFLALKRIAVAGVSHKKLQPANLIYRKLRGAGYEVFAVNPNADRLEGDTCYPDLKAIPEGVEGVVAATHPDVTEGVVKECAEAGISQVWIHRSFGKGSVSGAAVEFCRENGITVIDGGCPMMFLEPDVAHRCMRWFLGLTGGLPKEV